MQSQKNNRYGQLYIIMRTMLTLMLMVVLITPIVTPTHTQATYANQSAQPVAQESQPHLQPALPFNSMQAPDTNSVAAHNATAAPINLVVNGNFETADPSIDRWIRNNWTYTTTGEYEGSYAAVSEAGLNGSLMQTITFPETGIVATLSFWWKNSNPDESNNTLKVRIIDSDATFPYEQSYYNDDLSTNSSVWKYSEVNLNHIISDIAGKTLTIRFEVSPQNAVPDTTFYLDDVHLDVSSQDETIGLSRSLDWSSQEENNIPSSTAWGDVDGDGDLDLAVGNNGQKNQLFLNNDGLLSSQANWESDEANKTTSIAWGDVNGDGYLDLAVGNKGQENLIYFNTNGKMLKTTADWSSIEKDNTESIALGDINGDGYFDLVVGNSGQKNHVYYSNNGRLSTTANWSTNEANNTTSIALGYINGDDNLDLIVGNKREQNKVYYNISSGELNATPGWESDESDDTLSIALGDVNGDSSLDLAVGNSGQQNHIYLNSGNGLNTTADWSTYEEEKTTSVAFGDVDGDGDIDLAVGNESANQLYRNDGNKHLLTNRSAWTSDFANITRSVAWGDVDNDGDLDLAVGNETSSSSGSFNGLYFNDNGLLLDVLDWNTDKSDTTSIAFGDMDNDGTLDILTGNSNNKSNQWFLNQGGTSGIFNKSADGTTDETDNTTSIAFGDVNDDGFLDVVVGNGITQTEPNRLYLINKDGSIDNQADWISNESDYTTSVAFGDIDGDGDLDLVVGNNGQPNRMYRNKNGSLTKEAVWSSQEASNTTSIALGDIDDDGDLDLAVGNSGEPNQIYYNNKGILTTEAMWSSVERDDTKSIAFGDIYSDSDEDGDDDGELDLVVGNYGQPNRIYRNDQGRLSTQAVWLSEENDYTTSVIVGDIEGDGDLDIAVGNYGQPNRIYRNNQGILLTSATWSSQETDDTKGIAFGDIDNDGDLDLAVGNLDQPNKVYQNIRYNHNGIETIPLVHIEQTGLANGYATPVVYDDSELIVPMTYILAHPQSLPVQQVEAFVSLNGGDSWRPAINADTCSGDGNEGCTNIITDAEKFMTSSTGEEYTFNWNVFRTGLMGQYDNVVFRLRAIPSVKHKDGTNRIPGPFLYGSYATASLPFRVQGTQVKVVFEDGTSEFSKTLVYARSGSTAIADVIANVYDEPYHTNSEGVLQGHGILKPGDQLVALEPISATESFTYYITSATPSNPKNDDPDTGLKMQPVTVEEGGIQTLIVSKDNPLLIFNLIVSIEWNAQNDSKFLARLETDLQRVSELLFDWTDGQAALGDITIYHQREKWNDAHIRIYATNRLRPNSNQGGITSDIRPDTDITTIEYWPGQVRMGIVWNRYGDTTGTLGEDWPRTLAHELGHYAFFLDDNYLGLDEQTGFLKEVDSCPGVMTDPYVDNDSEFHTKNLWSPRCENTLSHQQTKRSDWETIKEFYEMLNMPDTFDENPGPSFLPLNTLRFHNVLTETAVLPVRDTIIYPKYEDGKTYISDRQARAFLLLSEGNQMIDLGSPIVDRIESVGARPGDHLCLYDSVNRFSGCEEISENDQQLTVQKLPDSWTPDIKVTPVTSRTFNLTVKGLPSGLNNLKAQLFPTDRSIYKVLHPLQYDAANESYTGTFQFDEEEDPVLEGYLLIQNEDDADHQFLLTDYSMGGNPGRSRGRHGRSRGRHGRSRGRHAPVSSTDGNAMVYSEVLNQFKEGEFYVLQTTEVASPPPWTNVVGQAYQLTKSPGSPSLVDNNSSLYIGYNTRDVVPGEEAWLQGYFWEEDQKEWRPIITSTLNVEQNTVSIPVQGEGTYALMSTMQKPLKQGWNNMAYPVRGCRTVDNTLASIEAQYNSVLHYNNDNDPEKPWEAWDMEIKGAPSWATNLPSFQFGEGYWIDMKEDATLYLKASPDGDSEEQCQTNLQSSKSVPLQNVLAQGQPNVPRLYYGTINTLGELTPTAGMPVTATINGETCGATTTRDIDGEIQYALPVVADTGMGGREGCGSPGAKVEFTVAFASQSVTMTQRAEWTSDIAIDLDLGDWVVYLPIVNK